MRTDHVEGRARCAALLGKRFRTPGGVVGTFESVLERPGGRPPVVVGRLPSGSTWKYTPSKAEGLLIKEGS